MPVTPPTKWTIPSAFETYSSVKRVTKELYFHIPMAGCAQSAPSFDSTVYGVIVARSLPRRHSFPTRLRYERIWAVGPLARLSESSRSSSSSAFQHSRPGRPRPPPFSILVIIALLVIIDEKAYQTCKGPCCEKDKQNMPPNTGFALLA